MSDAKYETWDIAHYRAFFKTVFFEKYFFIIPVVGQCELTAILTINDAVQDLRLRIYRFGVPAATKPACLLPVQRNHE